MIAGALAKGLGEVDRVLPGHRVGDEERLVRLGGLAHRGHFEHQLLVDVEPAGGVEDHDVIALGAPGLERAPGDRHRLFAGHDRQAGDADLAAEHGQLLLRRRALHVERGEQHLFALAALEPIGDLGRGRGLARALQPDQHDPDRRRRIEVEPARAAVFAGAVACPAQHLDQMVVDDLDHHLGRGDRAQHLLAQRLFAHRGDKIADHRQRHIGFEQRQPDLAQRGGDIILAQRAMAAQPVEDVAEAVGQAVEHKSSRNGGPKTHRASARHSRTGGPRP